MSGQHNFIYHIDVYQGKMRSTFQWHLPTTQKPVVNAIFSTRLYKDPDRLRELCMDHWYSAPSCCYAEDPIKDPGLWYDEYKLERVGSSGDDFFKIC